MNHVTANLSTLPSLTVALLLCACGNPDSEKALAPADASSEISADSQVSQDSSLADSSRGDAAIADAFDADGAAKTNPNVTLIRELTFEQPPGTNGWKDPKDVVFNWQLHPTGRHNVPDAFIRAAGGINIPTLATGIAYRGKKSVLFTLQPWTSPSTFRTDIEMVGNAKLSRTFSQGKTHVVGFAMRIEHAAYSGNFELYHQYHNGAPPKVGYGKVNNPALSLLRKNNTDLSVAVRANLPNGARQDSFFTLTNAVRAGKWVRWVFKTRFENFDSGKKALVEVYSAVGSEPLKMHLRVDDRPMGYVYENPDHNYEVVVFDLYGSPLNKDAKMFLDEVRIAEGDHPASTVDPINWASYQHPLNQPYNSDL